MIPTFSCRAFVAWFTLMVMTSCCLAYATDGKAKVLSQTASIQPLKPNVTEAQAALLSARFLTRFQYDAKPLNDAMSAKIYHKYLRLLDPGKAFFTQQDLAKFKGYREQLDNAIWNQNLSVPFDIFNKYIQRSIRQMRYARNLLKKSFHFNTHATYRYDRQHVAWPKDQKALNTLWRKRTMDDWLRLRLAGKKDVQIRKILDRRYRDYINRVRNMDSADAFQTFMNAYAESTDPHTDYFDPRAAKNFEIAMKLSLEGIGAVLQARDEYVQIRELVPASPAARSGRIHAGDRIVGVGQGKHGTLVNVIGWRLDDVVNLVRGKKDTVVRLQILPAVTGLGGKYQVVTLVRKKVTMTEQAAKKKIVTVSSHGVTRKIGVIDLPTFYSDFGAHRDGDQHFKSATRDVARLIRELKAKGVQGIIMDLRNNGGGSLYEARQLTGLFVGNGPVVQVRDVRGHVTVEDAEHDHLVWRGPLVVLVNRGTASASEIFAAAIQDYSRGLIIGTPTFGKGTVQNLINLDDVARSVSGTGGKHVPRFGALKMTIAEFFRINGGSTQLKGVTPDIAYPANGDAKDLGESTYSNALPWSHIHAASYKALANMHAWIPKLDRLHVRRVSKSPAWKLMLDQIVQYQKLRARTTVSLNLAIRRAQRRKLNALQARFRKRQRAIAGKKTAWLGLASVLDDGLNPGERSLKSQLKQEKEAKQAPDPELDETTYILFDAIGLIRSSPKLAAKVTLPQVKPTAAVKS